MSESKKSPWTADLLTEKIEQLRQRRFESRYKRKKRHEHTKSHTKD